MNGKMIVGILAFVGGVWGIIYFFSKSKSKDEMTINKKSNGFSEPRSSSMDRVNTDNVDFAKEKLTEEKADLAKNIKTRHEEAASEMKESLNRICNDAPVDSTENTETLNEMMDDLDKLMN